MRSVRSNYILRWVLPDGTSDDFDRVKNINPEELKCQALECWRAIKLLQKYTTIEIWQADGQCHNTVCEEPVEVVNLPLLDKLYN